MSSTRKNNTWRFLPIIILLCLIVGVGTVLVTNRLSQNGSYHTFHLPPCEAMRPYITYQGITYVETFDGGLTSATLGKAITTIGDGANQAKSCMDSGASVSRVKRLSDYRSSRRGSDAV